MNRTLSVLAAFALALASERAEAGVMLWQVTGMEGSDSRYAMAGRLKSMVGTSVAASALWGEWGVPGSGLYVMRCELWRHLLSRLAAPGKTAVPSYRDLISSGYISVNRIVMPECMGNNGE